MKQLKKIYQKYYSVIVKGIFPVLLFCYPFLTLNQGVDVSDSTYSFSNFLYFENMEGMWVVSTYLSNVFGWLLTKLPMGSTILGLKIYTTLLISTTVLLVYFMLFKWMPAWILFLGEMIAVGFCWIPSGILYNYLSYFFLTLGAVLFYQGLVSEKDKLLFAAGVVLGFNVFVRIPNVTQMALILGLWYYLGAKRKKITIILEKTAKCAAGYLLGVLIPLIPILARFGITGLTDMVQGLAGIQGTDHTYSAWSMIGSVIAAYERTFKWAFLMAIGTFMGMVMFFLWKGKWEKEKKLVYLLGILVLLRFLWGRGMFSFRYYEDYTSMYEWGMIGLYLAWIGVIYMLRSRKNSLEEKLWSVLIAVVMMITPLGSNNYTMQNLNNLFLVAPFSVYAFVKIFRRKPGQKMMFQAAFPWKAMVLMIVTMITIQSAGFHSQFVFRDGMDGSKRTYVFFEPASLKGMKTTKENGESLSDLAYFMENQDMDEKKVVLYGDCPGLSFILKAPVAIGSSWPDLDSYSYHSFVQDLEKIQEPPVIVVRKIEPVGEQSTKKKEYLGEFMEKHSYEAIFDNEIYMVYETQKESLK